MTRPRRQAAAGGRNPRSRLPIARFRSLGGRITSMAEMSLRNGHSHLEAFSELPNSHLEESSRLNSSYFYLLSMNQVEQAFSPSEFLSSEFNVAGFAKPDDVSNVQGKKWCVGEWVDVMHDQV